MKEKLLEIEGLKKYYGRKENQTKALDGVTFGVQEGEFLGIMGSSGSGKTTLLNCIASSTKPTEGQIRLKGEDICSWSGKKLANYRGSRVGYLFQNFELLDNLTARENILLPLAIHGVKEAQAQEEMKKV